MEYQVFQILHRTFSPERTEVVWDCERILVQIVSLSQPFFCFLHIENLIFTQFRLLMNAR
jgi:hypothetical protein